VDDLARRNVALDDVQEAKKLLMPMAFHVAADDGAVEDVKGGKQRCRAMAFIIMSRGSSHPSTARQRELVG